MAFDLKYRATARCEHPGCVISAEFEESPDHSLTIDERPVAFKARAEMHFRRLGWLVEARQPILCPDHS
jgi:hypothetical protein